MNGDYLDYLAHYRTPGSKNGISTTPGYDAIGKRAMTPEERRLKYKKAVQTLRSRVPRRKNGRSSVPGGKPSSFLERRKQQDQLKFEKWKIKNSQKREDQLSRQERRQQKQDRKQQKKDQRAEERQRRKEARQNQPTWKKVGKGVAIGGAVLGTAALVDLAVRGERSVVGKIGKAAAEKKNDLKWKSTLKKVDALYAKHGSERIDGLTKTQLLNSMWLDNIHKTDADISKAAYRANRVRQSGLEFVQAAVSLKDDYRKIVKGY